MARIYHVQKAAKPHTCGLGHPIEKGEPYTWAKPGFRGGKRYRCAKHPFRESDLATGLNQEPLAARETLDDTLDGLEPGDYDGLRSAVEDFQGALDEYVQAREDSLESWENGNATLEELRDAAQYARDDFEPDVDDFTEEEPEASEFEDSEDGQEEFESARTAWEESRDQHWADAVEGVRDAAMGLDL